MKWLKEMTHDVAATVAGYVVAGAGAAATAYLAEGGLTKERAAAWAVLGVCGHFVKRGNTTPIFKDATNGKDTNDGVQ